VITDGMTDTPTNADYRSRGNLDAHEANSLKKVSSGRGQGRITTAKSGVKSSRRRGLKEQLHSQRIEIKRA